MIEHRVLQAARELQRVLKKGRLPFCFIGGVAVQRWGEPRHTQDADATVLTEFVNDERAADLLLGHFEARRPDAREFALRNRVLLLRTDAGTHLDVALGALPFEAHCISRASDWRLPKGGTLRTCSAEDLIVHKAFASRDLDWGDVDRILMRQGRKLNVPQIFEELRPLVDLKEDATILPRLEAMMRKRGVLETGS